MSVAVVAAFAAVLAGACDYDPFSDECEVSCAEGECPSGMSCRGDGFCHEAAPGEPFIACARMVYVPAGPFVMGSDDGEGDLDEQPEHVVTLSGFSIDVHEATNAEWRACVAGGGCTEPSSHDSNSRTGYYSSPSYDDYPVVLVDWSQASAYCAWHGKRLPTEAEWEKAARGGCEISGEPTCGPEDERAYPWGDASPTCGLENANLDRYCVSGGDTDAVDARSPAGTSPYGVQNMSGNAAEWVADWYGATYYETCAGGCSDPRGRTPRRAVCT